MTSPLILVGPQPGTVLTGGSPVTVLRGPLIGGLVTNPFSATDQDIPIAEPLFVDLVGAASLSHAGTTFAIQPGRSFTIPPGFTGSVSVNATSSGHAFSAIGYTVFVPPPVPVVPSVVLAPATPAQVILGGSPVTVFYGPMLGGVITNPFLATDQGISGASEELWVDLVNPAVTTRNGTSFPLFPGRSFTIPQGFTGNVSVTALTAGHKFSAISYRSSPPSPIPAPGPFPPTSPSVLQSTIPSYLYVEYNDDSDLQAFVNAQNIIQQGYIDWFNQNPLPVYTNPNISGALLDWIGVGLYGLPRPALQSGSNVFIGPYNTFAYNALPINGDIVSNTEAVVATSDDVYKRILTWHVYKGDGKVFSIEWLKRRVIRFLAGPNGTSPVIDNTYPISVTLSGNNVTITFSVSNTSDYTFTQASVFQAAVQSQAVELPFQFNFNVVVNP